MTAETRLRPAVRHRDLPTPDPRRDRRAPRRVDAANRAAGGSEVRHSPPGVRRPGASVGRACDLSACQSGQAIAQLRGIGQRRQSQPAGPAPPGPAETAARRRRPAPGAPAPAPDRERRRAARRSPTGGHRPDTCIDPTEEERRQGAAGVRRCQPRKPLPARPWLRRSLPRRIAPDPAGRALRPRRPLTESSQPAPEISSAAPGQSSRCARARAAAAGPLPTDRAEGRPGSGRPTARGGSRRPPACPPGS